MHDARRPPKPEDFGRLFQPAEAMEPILAKPVRGALLEWLTEIWAGPDLKAVGIEPRSRALFYGAPGVGKTTLAHHLSARLGLPMLAVQSEQLIDKWVGSTGRNIGALFDCVATSEPVVLFFDEFDSIAQKRLTATQGSEDERNSFVNVLLRRIELHSGYIIAATNKGDALDPAIWRRFDIQIELALPGQPERERILSRYLAPFGLPSAALRSLAEAMDTASPALMRQFAENIKRQIVVGPKVGWDMRRDETVGRVLAAVGPHPDLGKPRLWSLGAADQAVRALPWPLPKAADVLEDAPPAADERVVDFTKRGRA